MLQIDFPLGFCANVLFLYNTWIIHKKKGIKKRLKWLNITTKKKYLTEIYDYKLVVHK